MEQEPTPSRLHATRAADSMRADATQKLHELLAGLWERSRSTIHERLDVLRAVHQRLCLNIGDQQAHKEGGDAAHKLAGILGTFGLPEGTELARNAEAVLERDGPMTACEVTELNAAIEQLHAMIERKTRETAPRGA